MKKITKKVSFVACLTMALAFFGAGIATANPLQAFAETSETEALTAETVGFSMEQGASVRYAANPEEAGIRFCVKMSKADYKALMAQVGESEGAVYSSISFGMIITKASYVTDNDLTVENLFDLNATDEIDNTKFAWKPTDAAEDWSLPEGKKLVVNQTFDYLGTHPDYENDYVAHASLTNIREYNLVQEFVGRAYMKYTLADGTTSYRMADYFENDRDNNVRSITYVAQKVVETLNSENDADKINTLKESYIDKAAVKNAKTTVTVVHHLTDVRGKETTETTTMTEQTIGETVTAEQWSDKTYDYDGSKSTASGVAYANGKTVLNMYYTQNPKKVYDIFFEDGDINGGYAIKDPIKLPEGTQFAGVKKDDSYKVTLEIDAISYTGTNAQFYLAVRNDTAGDPGVINHTGWIPFPVASGEKGTITYVLDAKLAADPNATQLAVYVCNVTACKIGVKVASVELIASPYDSLIKNSDIDSNGYAIKDPIVLSEAKQGKYLDEYNVTLDIDAKSYTSNQANGKIGLYVAVMNETNVVIGHTGWIEFPAAAGGKATKTYTIIANGGGVTDWTVSKVAVYVCNVTACEIGVDVNNVELVSKNRDLVINATGLAGNEYLTWPAPIVLSSEMQKQITNTTGRYKVTLEIDATYTPGPEGIGWYVGLLTNTDGDSGVIGHTGWVNFTVPSGTPQTVEVVINANLLENVTLTRLAVYVRFVKDCSISVKVANIELVP